jgi:WD40 repeat protein
MSNWPVHTQGGEVNSVATSGDGKVVVAGTYYHDDPPHIPAQLGTYAYDASGALLWQDSAAPKTGTQGIVKDQGVYWVAVSRDGQWAASAGGDHVVPLPPAPGIGTLTAYDMSTGNPTPILNAQIGGVNMVALSADGRYLVAGADAAYVVERTGSTFGTPVVLRDQIAATDSVVAVAISDDGAWAIYGTTGGKVGLYSTTAAEPPVVWTAAPNHYVKMVAMAADGNGFAAVTTNRAFAKKHGTPVECHAYFFDLNSSGSNYFPTTQSPTTMWTLNGCDGVMSVAINADGSRVAAVANVKQTTGTSGIVFFFDALSTTPIWVKPTLHGPNSVSTDDAGKQVAVADGFLSPGAFYLFDVYGASVPINGLQANQPGVVSWSIQLSADGKALVAGSDDAKVYYFGVAPATAPAAPTNVRIVT